MNDLQRLTEMGITVWELRRPELFNQKTPERISLPDTCKLLFVCDQFPTGQDLELFTKILSSINLLPNQTVHLSHQALSTLTEHALQWCWFVDCDPIIFDGVRNLHSQALSKIYIDQNAKKQLWQQIKKHGNQDRQKNA